MNFKNKRKINNERKKNKTGITKVLQESENRLCGKSGKILTVDYTGRPSFGKIVKLNGWFSTTKPVIEIVPDYKSCEKCDLFLGHEEEMNLEILDSMCIDCFSLETDQDIVFSIHYPQQKSCNVCGLPIENKSQLYSKLPGKCNHCFLRVTNSDVNHSYIHCNPNFHA